MTQISTKKQQLLDFFRQPGRIAIAFSGGVDSALVAKAAAIAAGDRCTAVIAESASLPADALDEAREVAALIGLPLDVLRTREFEKDRYRANVGDRCYFCKDTLYETIKEQASDLPYDLIVNGTNADDLGDYRPGLRAAEEHQVRSPLAELGFTKADVRTLAKEWELPVWNKPASPCLSSRITHGLEVTAERVRRVDNAERFLKTALGLPELRVRHEFNDLARIEVPLEQLPRLVEADVREKIDEEFTKLGFRYVTLDLQGFRSGSMNSVLPLEVLTQSQHQ